MKQLTIRLLAPFQITQSFALGQYSAKKLNQVITMPYRLVGKWRLYLNYCPECNSCAPVTHCCEVCDSDTRAFFNWNDDIKKDWWKKYAEKHHIAM